MKKIILSVVLVIIIVMSNFVFRYMHIRSINNNIELMTTKLSEKGLKFTYNEVKYEGLFFWNIDGTILKPNFYQKKYGVSDKSSMDYINLHSSLFSKALSIIFSDNIITLIEDSEGETKYLSSFSENPRIDLVYKSYFKNINKEVSSSSNLEQIFTDCLKSINYNSSDHVAKKVNADGSEEMIYSIDKTNVKIINISSGEYDGIKLILEVDKNKYYKNSNDEDFYNYFSEIGTNSTNLNTDILFNFKDDSKIELVDGIILENVNPTYKLKTHEFEFYSDMFNFDLVGNIVINKSYILPFFDLDFKIDNFSALVDFYLNFYNKFVINSGINKVLSLKEIKEKEKEVILKTAEKILKESSNTKEYDFKIINLKDKKIKINDYPMNEVTNIYDSFLLNKEEN